MFQGFKIFDMIKLIATDLDGTLFYPKNRFTGVPRCNRKFLRRFMDNGGRVLLVSGRNPKIVPYVERQLHHKVSLIGCNGGFYMDEEKKIHDAIPLNREKIVELFAYTHHVFGPWIWLYFDTSNVLYTNCSNVPKIIDLVFRYGNRFRFYFAETLIKGDSLFVDRLANHDCYKLLICFGLKQDGKTKAEQAAPALKSRFSDCFEFATSSNAIEITAKGVNKGNSLKRYCEENNIDMNEVAVCGDSGNDLYMFSKFNHTFAMAHSPDHFKEQANHVISRISDLQEYIDNPSLLENDKIKEINYEKALDK